MRRKGIRPHSRRAKGMLPLAAVLLALASVLRAGETLAVRVVDAEGEPVAGATVQVLWWADIDLGSRHRTLVRDSAETDAEGVAGIRVGEEGMDFACLLAFDATRAVFACHTPLERLRDEDFALRLERARVLRGRVVAGEDQPPEGARLRLVFPGGTEMHGVDASVADDGSFVFPPLPERNLEGGATLQARAEGCAAYERELDRGSMSRPIVVRMGGTRRVIGRVVGPDGEPVAGAEIWFGDWMRADKRLSGEDGAFLLVDAPTGAVTVHVLPPQHALRSCPVLAGEKEHDLGSIEVVAGRPVKGSVREFDGATIERAFVALETAEGVRVRSMVVGPQGTFTLPAVGEGPHRLDCWVHEVEGIGGSRRLSREGVRGGDPPLDLVVPESFRVRFVDATGAACPVHELSMVIASPKWRAPWDLQIQAFGEPLTEVRLLLHPGLMFDLELRPRGYRETTLEMLATDAKGRLTVDVPLVRDPETPLIEVPPFRDPLRGVPPPTFDKGADKREVRAHVEEVLARGKGRSSWSTSDPELRALQEVGPAHVDVLVDVLRSLPEHEGSGTWLRWAIDSLVDESHKALILEALPDQRRLVECVLKRGWEEDARETLVDALKEESFFYPASWIEAVARLRDPETYALLLRYLEKGSNPQHTWRAIRDLPGLDASAAVARGWAANRRSSWKQMPWAVVAAEFGHIDALETLIAGLEDKHYAEEAKRAVESRIEFEGTPAEIRGWFAENRDRLVFDEAARVFRATK